MANLGQLVVNLEANIARFTSDMGRASQTVEQTMGRMNAAADRIKNVLGAVGVALSVDLIVGEINKTIGALADLDDMAQKTGASVEGLSKLSKVAMSTGVDFGTVDGAIVKLAKNLADVDEKGNKTARALAAIGISTDDIKGKDPSQVFVDIANKLQAYEDGAGKVALATDLMGKSAADLLPYMNDVSESVDRFTGESAEAAAKATQLQDTLGLMKVKYEELKTEILIGAVPAATDFIQALMDTKREANNLSKDTTLNTWADDAAIVMARLVDRVKLTARALMLVGSSVKAVAADIQVAATLQPAVMAFELSQGRNPLDNFRATMKERDKIVLEANTRLEAFLNAPISETEENVIKRIAERQDKAGLAALGGMVGINGIKPGAGRTLSYGETPTPTTGGSAGSGRFADENDWTRGAAGARMVEIANDETFAVRNTLNVTNELIEADERRARVAEQLTARAENIRLSLMSEAEAEQFEFDSRIAQIQAFGALQLENEQQANAMIEAETARHEQAKYQMRAAYELQSLGAMGNTADQLYNMLKQSGEKQSSLARAAFLVSKGIAVAEIILQTNVAAAKAKGQLGIFGMPMAAVILATGYSQAAMVAGMAVASAEGGYDIPAGVNPVTQLHEKEMVLPKAQAEVIRDLATRGGAGGGGQINHTVNITIDGKTDMAENRKMISMAVAQGNADLVDKLTRAGRI